MNSALGPSADVPPPTSAWSRFWPALVYLAVTPWFLHADRSGDDVQPAVLVILAIGLVLGFARPRQWWLWAIAIGLWPMLERLSEWLGWLPSAYASDPGSGLIALIPAFAATLAGRTLRRAITARPRATA